MAEVVGTPVASADFRRALGHYPTGVAVVTARQSDGEPVAMVVGTFTSVSLDPPLVGFLPDRKSSSWPRIRETRSFCVSVLRADQEDVCRAFASKAPDRFTAHGAGDASSGSPRLAGAALWVDCDIEDVLPAGDHDMVLGRVRDLGIGEDAGLPLLFLRGGYGAPVLPSVQAEAPGLGAQLRLADLVRPEAEAIAGDLGLECLVSAVVDDAVVSLAAAGIGSAPGSDTRVGTTFPLAAPFGALFVAWSDDAEREAWLTRGSRLAGESAAELGRTEVVAVRSLGYAVTTGRPTAERFERALGDAADDAAAAEVLRTLTDRGPEPGMHAPVGELTDVTSLAVPVRDRAGRTVMSLHLIGFTGTESPQRLRSCLERLTAGALRAGALVSA